MGFVFSKLFSVFKGREIRILILGLDNAGKTTILYRLQSGQMIQTLPTVGLNVEELKINGLKLSCWDLGGQELFAMLQEEELRRVPVLIFANKTDLVGALDPAAIAEQMHLTEIRDRPWHIQPSSAVAGTGLVEGFTWLTNLLK